MSTWVEGGPPEAPARGRLGAAPLEKPTPPPPAAALKGAADGLKVVVTTADAVAALAALKKQLGQRPGGFFAGADVELLVEQPALDAGLVAAVGRLLAEHGMVLTAASSIAGRPPRQRPSEAQDSPDAIVVARTLRSGQRVAHSGSVVILGDVNPGAEVSAGGSVIVWGRARGTLEAGLDGSDAVVCALDLSPAQLRIGQAVARAPEGGRELLGPELARRVGEAIVVEPWQ